ncbi:protein dispatched homolog 1-like isoform X2 [Saccostrea echinata]|uniref:protein dispatched homolog 1-like isoform X2 n=1 Tax=Saccostrea echinata TaxID=191078 RepID=UPI002A819DBE|nr:protein dispatched homolog 1-like isoform X2 [Saccostrea echinata]
MRYARLIAHYPYVIIVSILCLAVVCLVLCVTVVELPNFQDPRAGFEPRGTDIANRIIAYNNLVENRNGKISIKPGPKWGHHRSEPDTIHYITKNQTRQRITRSERRLTEQADRHDIEDRSTHHQKQSYFCNIEASYFSFFARIVFSSADGSNLFTASKLKEMCHIEDHHIRTHSTFTANCQTQSNKQCCLSWSLGNYVAMLSGKSNCSSITDQDVRKVEELLRFCAGHYYNKTLNPTCDTDQGSRYYCSGIPKECVEFQSVYNILHHIADVNFIHPDKENQKLFLTYAIMYLPLVGGVDSVKLFQHIESWPKDFGNEVRVTGANFGIKGTLFSQHLIADSMWLLVSGIIIFLVIWLYSLSIFITVMTFFMMFWSLEIAYILYMLVFRIGFFPYMNLVAVIIILAIGADDVFIYCRVWRLAKSVRNNGNLEKIVSDTLRNGSVSMFVTSLTTAAALYCNAFSSITSIKCFSIYAGTAVLCNFILVVTWMPASIVIYEKWCNCEKLYNPELSSRKNVCFYICKLPQQAYHKFSECSRILFEKLLPFLVIRARFIWLVIFSLLGILGIVVIFFYPKLKLPTSEKFQVFSSNHLMEKYDFVLNDQFWFERQQRKQEILPLRFVWGVKATDTGSCLDPTDKGDIVFDEHFDPTTQEAQLWMLNFCQDLRQTDFYQNVGGFEQTNCFFEFFSLFMQQPCSLDFHNQRPCCNYTTSLIKPHDIMQCVPVYIPSLINSPSVIYNSFTSGPRFTNGRFSALIIEFYSNFHFTTSFHDMSNFYNKVEQFFQEKLKSAPPEVKHGWFVSELDFFSLQKSLSEETPVALGISLFIVTVVTFLTTLNVLISVFAIVSIAFVMFVTIAALTLLGWELNILESVVITVAVGLSIDLTLHVGVSFRNSPDLSSELRVASTTSKLGGVVTMAATTTFLAGALMMPSTVLAYQKFGTFLMIIISISWTYAVFFFQSLLCVLGPHGGFGQFHWPSAKFCHRTDRKHVDKTVYLTTESSSGCYPPSSSFSEPSQDIEIISNTPKPSLFQHRRSRSRGHYMKAHTRSDSPESNNSERKESQVKFSESCEIANSSPEIIDDKRTSRTDDSVFKESRADNEVEGCSQSFKPIPIEIHFRESLT